MGVIDFDVISGVMVYLWQGTHGTDIYLSGFSFQVILSLQSSSLHPEQQCRGHLDNFDFPCGPIDFGVMFTEPRMSKYHFLSAQARDSEGGPFRVFLVAEYEAYYFCY